MKHIHGAFWLVLVSVGCTEKAVEECDSLEVLTYGDLDGDGFGNADDEVVSCGEIPQGRSAQSGDCDDNNADIFPGVMEICDGLDNDCNGDVDDDLPMSTWFEDSDGDGFGAEPGAEFCGPQTGWVTDASDCDDASSEVHPDADEVCDGVDNDCDARIDEEDPDLRQDTLQSFYADQDMDGYGDPETPVWRCSQPVGTVTDASDCDDDDADVNPSGQEVCGEGDEDCDGLLDDEDPDVDPATMTTWYADVDGDGFGDAGVYVDACEAPLGYVADSSDCDDTTVDAGPVTDWLADVDGDGYGAGASFGAACTPPGDGMAPAHVGLDCDDADAAIHPGATEICNDGVDQDCDGSACAEYVVGSADDDLWQQSGYFRGNLFEVVDAVGLLEFGLYLDLSAVCSLDFYVHTASSDAGPWTPVWSASAVYGPSVGYHPSPAIDIQIDPGQFVGLGVGWDCSATYFGDDLISWPGTDAGVGLFAATYWDNAYTGYSPGYAPTNTGSNPDNAYYMFVYLSD